MASTRMSPGGALLRASRVFAIPNPLPRPTGILSSQATYDSDTATLPHPIHQSITTPQSSLAKGDWGFKRPLPLRATTRTSTPIIRVEAIDTFEHVTEFNSAADHSLTLKKWQEMNLPISTPTPRRSNTNAIITRDLSIPKHRSIFEDDIDTTVTRQGKLSPAMIGRSKDDTRWKFSGPWLAGLTEGEFQSYIAKEVGRKKSEFRQFLRESCALDLTNQARTLAQKNGEDIGEVPTTTVDDISEEQLSIYIRRLREDVSTLYLQIRAFLDLAPSPAPKDSDFLDFYSEIASRKPVPVEVSSSPYAESGPPKTHPSAGLSYGRTNSWTYNHALYGPQAHPPPVEARIVMPKMASGYSPVLGVGGVVTSIPIGHPEFDVRPNNKYQSVPGLMFIDPVKYGGAKTWVEPNYAYIDATGKIVLSVLPASKDAVAVKQGKVDEIPEPLQMKFVPAARMGFQRQQNGSGAGYGVSF